jgi:hypothetical protein
LINAIGVGGGLHFLSGLRVLQGHSRARNSPTLRISYGSANGGTKLSEGRQSGNSYSDNR